MIFSAKTKKEYVKWFKYFQKELDDNYPEGTKKKGKKKGDNIIGRDLSADDYEHEFLDLKVNKGGSSLGTKKRRKRQRKNS